jgi:hypothetical protein
MLRTIVLMIIAALNVIAPAAEKPVPVAVTKAREATVYLQSAHGASSGFLVWREKTRGVIATTCHGIADAINANVAITARFAGVDAEAALAVTVLSCDLERDVAFLAVTSERLPQPVKLDSREKLQTPATLWICGFPPVAAGKDELSAVAIEAVTLVAVRLDQRKLPQRLQLGADLKRSFSGAPLLTAKGEVVGVAYQDFSGIGEGLAIPIAHVEEALAGRISHVDTRTFFTSTEGLQVEITSRLIDPLGNITKVIGLASIYDRADHEKVARAPDEPKGPAVSGMAEHPMVYQEQWAVGIVTLKRADIHDDAVIQLAVERKEGKRFYSKPKVASGNQFHPGRVDVAFVGKGDLQGPLVQPTDPAPIVKVIEVPGRDFLPANIERDDIGRAFVAVSSKGEKLKLDPGVTAFASHPSGSEVYITFKNPLCLRVFDPHTWTAKAEIPLPGYPVDVWADATTVAVSCASAQQIVLIDPGERRITGFATIPRYSDMFPARVIGRAPDGSLMSIWNRDEEESYRRRWRKEAIWEAQDRGLNALVHTASDGTSRVMINGEYFKSAVWLRDGKGIIGEIGSGADLSFPNGSRADMELRGVRINFHGPDLAFSGFCSPLVSLRDRSWILYPRYRFSAGGPLWTFLVSPQADKIADGFPGEAICEVPDQGMIFSTGHGPMNSSKTVYDHESGYCYYVSNKDFTIQRRIRVFSPPGDLGKRNKSLRSGVRYVPGHELMLVPWGLSEGKAEGIICYRCGPVDPAVTRQSAPDGK